MTAYPNLMTRQEFEAFIERPENSDRLFELINGEIIEKMPTELHGFVGGNIFGFVWNFNRVHQLGHVTIKARHGIPDDDHNDLLPDVSFILDTSRPLVEKGAVPRMPDLAVEVKSPTNKLSKRREKAAYYIANGTRIVWLVIPEKRLVEVYRPDADIEVLDENDVLDGGDVLPGFTLPIRDIFPQS